MVKGWIHVDGAHNYSLNDSLTKEMLLFYGKKEILAKTLAKRNATNLAKGMTKTEISGLINQLFNTAMPAISPDGKQTMRILSLNELAELILN